MPSRELFGLRVEVLRFPLELAANEPLHASPMPEWDHGRCTVFVGSEQEPLSQLLAESATLPPFPNARMVGKSHVASLCLLKIEVLLSPALPGPLAYLRAYRRQLDAELPGQIQRRLYGPVEPALRRP